MSLSNPHPRRRHWAVVAAASLTVPVALSACSASSGASDAGGKGQPAKGSTITIGASISLSGDFADSGQAVKRGYELWAQSINARGGLLGHPVKFKIVDDASSPTQVVTNYQTMISKDKVNLVVGPFSSLLTVPASQVAKRYGYAFLEPAGGGPKVFDQKLDNLFETQRAPVVTSGMVFVDWLLSLPAKDRPKTAAYPELDDPFAEPIAEAMRAKLEAAGIKTVYRKVYGAETLDLTPVMSAVAAAKPDLIVSGTQNEDGYAQVKALVQTGYSPRFMFMANGPSSPAEFPAKVGANNTEGIMSYADWFPTSKAPGNKQFVQEYLKKYGGTADTIDPSSAEAYAVGQILEAVAKKTGKIDNQTIIKTLHSGSWPTLLGSLSWNSVGEPQGTMSLIQWQKHKIIPVYPAADAQATPTYPKPSWGG